MLLLLFTFMNKYNCFSRPSLLLLPSVVVPRLFCSLISIVIVLWTLPFFACQATLTGCHTSYILLRACDPQPSLPASLGYTPSAAHTDTSALAWRAVLSTLSAAVSSAVHLRLASSPSGPAGLLWDSHHLSLYVVTTVLGCLICEVWAPLLYIAGSFKLVSEEGAWALSFYRVVSQRPDLLTNAIREHRKAWVGSGAPAGWESNSEYAGRVGSAQSLQTDRLPEKVTGPGVENSCQN